MKRFLSALFLALASFTTFAQPPAPTESHQLANRLVSDNWDNLKKNFPSMAHKLETQLQAVGVSAGAAHIVSGEFQRAITRESLSQALSQSLEHDFSPDELHEILLFVSSGTGQKFQRFLSHMDNNLIYLTPIIHQACKASIGQINGVDRFVVTAGCAQLDRVVQGSGSKR